MTFTYQVHCLSTKIKKGDISKDACIITHRKHQKFISEFFKSKQTKSDEHDTNPDWACTSTVPLASTANPDKIQSQTVANPPPVVCQAVAKSPPPSTSHTTKSNTLEREGVREKLSNWRNGLFLFDQLLDARANFFVLPSFFPYPCSTRVLKGQNPVKINCNSLVNLPLIAIILLRRHPNTHP